MSEFFQCSAKFLDLFSKQIEFNHEIQLDLMFLEKRKPVLHITDAGTKLNGGAFLRAASSAAVWNSIVRCWSATFLGNPERILTDSGSCFTSKEFDAKGAENGIIFHTLGEKAIIRLDPMRRSIILFAVFTTSFWRITPIYPVMSDFNCVFMKCPAGAAATAGQRCHDFGDRRSMLDVQAPP